MQQYVGYLEEMTYGFRLEVYADLDELSGRPEHVYVLRGRRQVGDFPYGAPTNVLEEAAQRLVSTEAEYIEFSDGLDEVIDWEDTLRMKPVEGTA